VKLKIPLTKIVNGNNIEIFNAEIAVKNKKIRKIKQILCQNFVQSNRLPILQIKFDNYKLQKLKFVMLHSNLMLPHSNHVGITKKSNLYQIISGRSLGSQSVL
jgi:hypothetical protein